MSLAKALESETARARVRLDENMKMLEQVLEEGS